MPNPGGIFQQHENHIKKMEKVLLAKDKWQDVNTKKQMKEAQRPPNES